MTRRDPAPPPREGASTTRRGGTLVELVLALGLASLLGLALAQLFRLGLRTTRGVDRRAEVADELGGALLHLGHHLRYARELGAPAPGASGPLLEFTGEDHGAHRVRVRGGDLVLESEGRPSPRVLAREVGEVRFERVSDLPGLVYLELEAPGPAEERRYRTAFFTRGRAPGARRNPGGEARP